MLVRSKSFKMYWININLMVLVSFSNLPYCYTKCENYYIIMEKNIDVYNPIKKDYIPWTISNIHHNNETNEFDMNCVLNLYCDRVETNLEKIITTVPQIGNDSILLNELNYKNKTLTDTKNKNYEKVFSLPEIIEDITFPSEEKPRDNSTLKDKTDDSGLDLEVTTTDSSVHGSESTNPNTSGEKNDDPKSKEEINTSSMENSAVTTEESTNSTDTENSNDNNGVKEGTNVTDSENHEFYNSTESSNEILEETTTKTDFGSEVFKDVNSTVAKDKIKMAGNVNDSLTVPTGTDYQKYNPEDSKKLAYKVMAGTLGALTAVGVCILVKYGASKLIAHITQAGVYRLPDP